MRFNYEREQKQFTDAKIARLPMRWAVDVALEHTRRLNSGIAAANDYLRQLVEPLEGFINISSDDDAIKKLADDLAFRVREWLGWCGGYYEQKKVLDNAQELCERYSVRWPVEFVGDDLVNRLVSSAWWLRGLRSSHAKAREAAARDAGIVHRKHDVYVSDDTLERRTQQRKRNAELLQGIDMVNEDGEVMSLAAIAATGMANQENRRAELMTRVTGFEQLAIKYSHKAIFVTLTCPSRMHATLTSGKVNQKYDGTKPDAAQKYLVAQWAKARALLHKGEVKYYGLRVAEPHHDGTPHWHLILFYDGKPSSKRELKRCIIDKFTEIDSAELARDISPRVKFVDINPSKGTAAGYVVKYVSKNIGGIEGEKSDEADASSETLAARVEAWASTWRIRQFQQVGGHFVTVWRELRRVDESELDGKRPQFVKAWQAAQRKGEVKANFAQYIECMGGLEVKAREGLLKVDYDAVNKRGRYGEAVVLKVLGVGERFGRDVVRTNRKEWVQL